MWGSLLCCALTLGVPAEGNCDEVKEYALRDVRTVEVMDETVKEEEPAINEKFWIKRKSLRIGYEFQRFQTEYGGEFPAKFGIGLSNVTSVWLHKKPIARRIKFGFDHGIDLNYTMFDTDLEANYTGPTGYLGSATPEDSELPFDISDIGSHYFSLGYALGVSVTVNPVAQLRVAGYVHFVPSFAMQFSGMSINMGFMPYMKYGVEVTYSRIGVGVEWGTGVSKMTDIMTKLESESSSTVVPKSRYYSNYTKIYLAIRLGKAKH